MLKSLQSTSKNTHRCTMSGTGEAIKQLTVMSGYQHVQSRGQW